MTTVADIRARYLVALAEVIEPVLDWWSDTIARHGERAIAMRWPRGPATHPRIVGIFRAHHAELIDLRDEAPDEPLPTALSFADDSAWGADSPAEPSQPTLDPQEVLVDGIADEYPAFHAFICEMWMLPVGAFPPTMPTLEQLAAQPEPGPPRVFEVEFLPDVEFGVLRLLSAPSDLRNSPLPIPAQPTWAHLAAFRAYCVDLEDALVESVRAWQGRLRMSRSFGRTDAQALEDAYVFTVAGPAGHGRVLGVIQTYWALCEQLNASLPPEHRVAPELLLLDWLRDGKHDSWVKILAGLPYWPVGLDAEGNWF